MRFNLYICFVSLFPVGITSSAVGLNICAIIAWIKKCKSIIKKKKNKHDKIVLLRKDTLHRIEVFISKALINSDINHDEFVSVNNGLREWKKILKQWKPVVSLAKNTYTAIENSNFTKNKQNRLMILSSCAACG